MCSVTNGKVVAEHSAISLSSLGFALNYPTESKTHFVNVFSQAMQTAAYIRSSLPNLVEYIKKYNVLPVHNIKIWADNGLRNYAIVHSWTALFALIPELKGIEINHFVPYHGHCTADADFGVLKRALREQFFDKGEIHPDTAINFFKTLPHSPGCPTDQ